MRAVARYPLSVLTSVSAIAKVQSAWKLAREQMKLRQTLEDVAERVERYRGAHIGEQNTKATLIVPVLRALGWNVEDLDEVHLEYKFKSQDRPVDYALMLQRKPVLFIEAKGASTCRI